MSYQLEELKKNISRLHYANARLLQELQEADTILKRVGFDEGLKTVRSAAEEILRQKHENNEKDDDEFE